MNRIDLRGGGVESRTSKQVGSADTCERAILNKRSSRVSVRPASPFTRPRPWLTVLAVIGGMVGWGLIFGVCYLIYIWRF